LIRYPPATFKDSAASGALRLTTMHAIIPPDHRDCPMKRLLLAATLGTLTMPAFAASLGYQQATSLSTSVAANLPSVPSGGVGSFLLSVESAGVRWRDDGTDPTSSVGQPVAAGQALCYGNDPHTVRIIGQTGAPTINVTYYVSKWCAQ